LKPKIENELVEKALSKDPIAFGDLYFALRGSIYGFAFRMLRERTLAENVTQEVFMYLFENPDRFDSDIGDLLPFLCGITRNKILGHFRKHGTKLEVSEDDMGNFAEQDDLGSNPLTDLLDEELNEKIEEEIAALSPVFREVLILREIEELSYKEICKITDTDLNLVRVRIHRARKKLANALKPYLVRGEEKHYEVSRN